MFQAARLASTSTDKTYMLRTRKRDVCLPSGETHQCRTGRGSRPEALGVITCITNNELHNQCTWSNGNSCTTCASKACVGSTSCTMPRDTNEPTTSLTLHLSLFSWLFFLHVQSLLSPTVWPDKRPPATFQLIHLAIHFKFFIVGPDQNLVTNRL